MPAEEPVITSYSIHYTKLYDSYDFALGLLKRGLNSEAAVEFAKFLARYPNSEKYNPALLNRAEALFNARDFTNAARTYYDYLTRSRSTDRAPRLRYGICLYELIV